MRKLALMLLLISCMSCAHGASGLVTDGPSVQESTCDIADECCEIHGERWCCFDDGKKIRCAKDNHVPLGDVE